MRARYSYSVLCLAVFVAAAGCGRTPISVDEFVAPGSVQDAAAFKDAPTSNLRTPDGSSVGGDLARDVIVDGGTDLPRPTDAGAIDGPSGIDAGPQTVTRIDIAPAAPVLGLGTTVDLTVTASLANGMTVNVSTMSTFTSSAPAIASVTGRTVRGLAAGSTVITATYMGRTATARVTVTAAALTSISIEPPNGRVTIGGRLDLRATAAYADGSKQDITDQAAWTSSDAAIAAVSNAAGSKGQTTGARAGTTTISAALLGVTGRTTITVTGASIRSIDVTPARPILPVRVTRQFQATATYSDGTTADVTAQATWTSSNPAVAVIVPDSAVRGLVMTVSAGMANVTATVGGTTGSTQVTVTQAALTAIQIAPPVATLSLGATQPFTATGTYSDGSRADVSGTVTWSSSNDTVATVSNAAGSKGLATALAAGSAQISASLGGVTAAASITVSAATLARLSVNPKMVSLAVGRKLTFTATGTYSDGSQRDVTQTASWTSSDATVVAVSNGAGTAGEVTALKPGSATITVTLAGQSDTATVTVSTATLDEITVAPAMATAPAGNTQTFTASGRYSDGSTGNLSAQVTWSSDDTRIAVVSNAPGSKGVATALASGTVTIRARLDGKEGTASFTVGAPILLSLFVVPPSATIRIGQTQNYQAQAVFSNGTTSNVSAQAMWTSSNPAVATVTTMVMGMFGVAQARGVSAGNAMIRASYMGKSADGQLIVSAATLTGLMVSPPVASIKINQPQPFSVNALFSDGSSNNVSGQATWTSSNPAIAIVMVMMGPGLPGGPGMPGPGGGGVVVVGRSPGTATITATYMGLQSTATITVTAPVPVSLTVTPPIASIRTGQMQPFQAIVVYDDGTDQDVTGMASWTSSNPMVAVVSSGGGGPGGPGGPGGGGGRGIATGLAAGTTTITATYMGKIGTASLTVSAATLTSVQVTPTNPSIPKGGAQQFTATALYSDFSTRNVTNDATWTSSNAGVASVSNAMGSTGRAVALSEGSTEIAATYMGQKGVTQLIVTGATVSAIQVTPTNVTTPVGVIQRFTATALLSDNTTQNVTNVATWTTSDAAVATISNAMGSRGFATPLKAGTTTVTATYMSLTGSTMLVVSTAKIQSVTVAPVMQSLAKGARLQFTATARYDDGSTIDVTRLATWISTDTAIATISNADDSRGLATGVAAGMTNIQAWFQGIFGMTSLTITP